jgi:hypothetical protein
MSMQLTQARRDCLGGTLMLLIGAGALAEGATYDIGTLNNMGPGFFPVALGVLMTLVGLGILISAWLAARRAAAAATALAGAPARRPEWAAWACILGGIAAFVGIGEYGGLAPATFALVFISALGDRTNTAKRAALLALAMVVISAVVFRWALKLQFPLFSWG